MNIFKILSTGDGRIKEPNVSSFLTFLLDPNESHGMGSSFLEKFISPLVLVNRVDYNNLIYDNKVRDLSKNSPFKITLEIEKKVPVNESKRRDIDILIEIKLLPA